MFEKIERFLLNEKEENITGKVLGDKTKASAKSVQNQKSGIKAKSKLESLLALIQTTYKTTSVQQHFNKDFNIKEMNKKFNAYAKEITEKYKDDPDSKDLDDLIKKFDYYSKHTDKIVDFFTAKEKKDAIYSLYDEEQRLAREERIGGRLVKLEEKEKMKKQFTRNFNLSDFLFCNLPPMEIIPNLEELAKNLQILYDTTQCKIEIISAYRSPARNKEVSKAEDSQHIQGTAADINMEGLSPLVVYKLIEMLIKKKKMKDGGLGLYDDFVHYDVRKSGRWRGDNRENNKGDFNLSNNDKKDIKKIIDSMGASS